MILYFHWYAAQCSPEVQSPVEYNEYKLLYNVLNSSTMSTRSREILCNNNRGENCHDCHNFKEKGVKIVTQRRPDMIMILAAVTFFWPIDNTRRTIHTWSIDKTNYLHTSHTPITMSGDTVSTLRIDNVMHTVQQRHLWL